MNIEIQQPQPFDLVDNTVLIAGNAVGFEGHLTITVSEGHFEFTTNATTGSTSIRQFQAQIVIPNDVELKLDRLHVSIADDSAGDGDGIPAPVVTIPVLYGPRILPGYGGYWLHTVASGETLSALANRYYDDSTQWQAIFRANPHLINDPDIIFVGQVLRIPRVL